MDRFKFRVNLKLETKSILLYSNNVNFDNREMILSGKDFKKQIESYNLTPKDYEFLYAYVYEEDVDYNPNYFVEFDDIEQSTGLKDKNDKLIYEGDIVKGKKKNPYSNFYDDYLDYCEVEVRWNKNGFDCLDPNIYEYTIIGNIHTGESNDNKK